MSVIFEVNEGTTAWLDVSFYGKTGTLEVPDSAVYEIWDIESDSQVLTETSLPAASQVEITLSANDNRVLGQSHQREARRVIVTGTFAGTEKLVQDFVYHVRNVDYKTT